ncbi:hypothetical protein SAMN06269301_1328 [Geobacter sp. DSM 9736]|nr:hypothetical protein SAMN06269301_1328 [Geobacter sp. DSM 9736]
MKTDFQIKTNSYPSSGKPEESEIRQDRNKTASIAVQ